MAIDGITEDDIAHYLANNPAFFERHAELLSSVTLKSPHGARAVSLQERQMEMLREKIKGLERRLIDMIRHGQENVAIADRLHAWTLAVLLATEPTEQPQVLVRELQHQFLIPQAALRLWHLAPGHEGQGYAQPVSDDVKVFANSLSLPYCGANSGFEAVRWMDDATTVTSMAMVPLRGTPGGGVEVKVFGMLVLGSPDPTRYSADMGTEFLQRIGDIASAALARLLAPAA